MKRELVLTQESIDEAARVSCREMSPGMGAAVSFAGVVRAQEDGARIEAIEYEAFEKMARHQFDLIFEQVEKRWPVESIRLAHRLGPVPVGQASLWLEVIAPHRAEAFAAAQFIVDEMKRTVPIWKKPLRNFS